MPRNRQTVDRDSRVQEVLTAASPLFVESGYAATSMTAVARAAGLTPTAVRWYFPDKDALFAAVLDRLVTQEQAAAAGLSASPADRLLHVLDRLQFYGSLQATLHARSATSPVIAVVRDRVHEWLSQLAREAVTGPPGSATAEIGDHSVAADALVACIEGALQSASGRPASEMVGWVLAQLVRQHVWAPGMPNHP